MRVITGTAKGIQLKTPDGMNTRPTADRVKEALFSIIQFEIMGAKVLDLFGGTGQLGIEALSRKAANSMTRITGNEHMTVMYSVDLFWKRKDFQKVQNAPYNSGVCLNGP